MDDDFPIPVYAAMLAATVAGQVLGIALDAVVLHARTLWVPLACSLLLESLVAARQGAARLGHPSPRAIAVESPRPTPSSSS